MAAGLVVPVSGPSIGLWGGSQANPPLGGQSLGTQNDDGYVLSCAIAGQEVNASDAYGLTLVEAIWRGQNWRCRFTGLEWGKPGLLNLHQMFGQLGVNTFSPGNTIPTVAGGLAGMSNMGDRWTKYCTALQLIAILSNPPTYPTTLTAMTAGLAPNSQTSYMLTSKMREMPLEMVLLPYATVVATINVVVPFTVT